MSQFLQDNDEAKAIAIPQVFSKNSPTKNKFPLHVKPVDLSINEPFSMKKESNASSKSIDTDQPAQSAQADLGRNFLLLVNFLHIKELYYFMIHKGLILYLTLYQRVLTFDNPV